MKESEIISSLDYVDSQVKVAAIEHLRGIVQSSRSLASISNVPAIFSRIPQLLRDANSNTVVYSALNFLLDIHLEVQSPDIQPEFLQCLESIVGCLGNSKHAIRNAAANLLGKLSKFIRGAIFNVLIRGCNNPHFRTRLECVETVVRLVLEDQDDDEKGKVDTEKEIWLVFETLVDRLRDDSASIVHSSANGLGQLQTNRPRIFKICVKRLQAENENLWEWFQLFKDKLKDDSPTEPPEISPHHGAKKDKSAENLIFGMFPADVIQKCKSEDWKTRAAGVEMLQRFVSETDCFSVLGQDMNSLEGLGSFLRDIVNDVNFKITVVALNIFEDIVGKLDKTAKILLDISGSVLLLKLGDTRTLIRQSSMRIFNSFMQACSNGKTVLVLASKYLSDENPRVREEAINLILSVVLQYPDGNYDFKQLTKSISKCLEDERTRVRYVALESIAVFYNIDPQISRVLTSDQAMHLQVRSTSKILPTLTIDGLVDHLQPRGRSASSLSRGKLEYEEQNHSKESATILPFLSLQRSVTTSPVQLSDTSYAIEPVKHVLSAATQRRIMEKMQKISAYQEERQLQQITMEKAQPVITKSLTMSRIRPDTKQVRIKTAAKAFQRTTKSVDDEILDALEQIKGTQWEAKVEGLESLNVVLQEQEAPLNTPHLHTISVVLTTEIFNLRTQVSRVSIIALGELYRKAAKNIIIGGTELDMTISALFKKAGESGAKDNFMADEIDRSLAAVRTIQGRLAPTKVLNAFIAALEHRNPIVRSKAALNISALLKLPEVWQNTAFKRIMQSGGTESVKFVKAVAKMLNEGLLETRTHAKAIVSSISEYCPELFPIAEKNISSKEFFIVKQAAQSISKPRNSITVVSPFESQISGMKSRTK